MISIGNSNAAERRGEKRRGGEARGRERRGEKGKRVAERTEDFTVRLLR